MIRLNEYLLSNDFLRQIFLCAKNFDTVLILFMDPNWSYSEKFLGAQKNIEKYLSRFGVKKLSVPIEKLGNFRKMKKFFRDFLENFEF